MFTLPPVPAEWLCGMLALALVIDWILGEWPHSIHPVVWMGHLIGLASRLRPAKGPILQFLIGLLAAVIIPCLFTGGMIALLILCRSYPWVQWLVGAFFLKSSFAIRALGRAAKGMIAALEKPALDEARHALSHLCSRDPSDLNKDQLSAATIESVSENLSDSFIAPVFYFVLFGVPGAICYRVINTMDAMIGYHGPNEYFGKCAARLDDLLNLIPARLTAVFLVLICALQGFPFRKAISIWHRDASKTESPNAGHPMAVMAGALGVVLEKPGHYRLGDSCDTLDSAKIAKAWRMVKAAALLFAGVAMTALGAWSLRA